MNVRIFVTIGSNSSTIIHSSLELNVLKVILDIIIPLINHSVDNTFAFRYNFLNTPIFIKIIVINYFTTFCVWKFSINKDAVIIIIPCIIWCAIISFIKRWISNILTSILVYNAIFI